MASNKIRLLDLFRYYKAGLPHQMAAIAELEESINAANPHILGRNQAWFKTWSTSGKQQDLAPNTWLGVSEAAQKAGAKFPELVAAQWALESGWGKHLSGKHNYFGLKGSGTSHSTQEFVNGKFVTITDSFIDFPDLFSCVEYLVTRWHKDFKTYKGCNNAANRDKAARWLVREGYATDPNYAIKLIALMEKSPAAGKPPLQQSAPLLTPSAPFTTLITPNISYGEICVNEERRRFANQAQCNICVELCTFIEKARAQFGGKPVIITSGHRPKAVNAEIGGASNSEHLYNIGCGAIDFYISGVPVKAVQDWCDANWPYSLGYGAKRGFIHLGIRNGRDRLRWDY